MNTVKKFLLAFLFLYILSITYSTSSDFDQDLGRHLKLGEIILHTKTVPKTNLFSYTNPNFSFINHHWLSEVAFYMLTSQLGINSLLFLKIFLVTIALSIILFYCIKQSGILSSAISILILSPLLFDRQYIRPELFGYVGFCLLLYIFLSYPKTKKYVWSVPFFMALWVNLHISFVFGILMIFLFMIKLFFEKKKKFSDFSPFFISFPALLINPYGAQGALYPFYIFRNYGYTIAENQNMFYLNSLFFSPFIRYFFVLIPIVLISFFVLLYKKKFYLAILLAGFFFLSLWQIRHIPFFIYVAIPSFSYVFLFVGIYVKKGKKFGRRSNYSLRFTVPCRRNGAISINL